MAANANPAHALAEDFTNYPDTLGANPLQKSSLDILAEAAGQQQYLPVPQRGQDDLLALAEVATRELTRLNLENDASVNANARPDSINADHAGSSSEAEDTIIVRPIIRDAKKTPSFISRRDRPLLGGRKKKNTRRSAAKKFRRSLNDSSDGDNDSDGGRSKPVDISNLTFPTTSAKDFGNTAAVSKQEKNERKRCSACDKIGAKALCQVVRKNQYHSACLRCVSRGDMKKCSLYEGAAAGKDADKKKEIEGRLVSRNRFLERLRRKSG